MPTVTGISSTATQTWQVVARQSQCKDQEQQLEIAAVWAEETGSSNLFYAAQNGQYDVTMTVRDANREERFSAVYTVNVSDPFTIDGEVTDNDLPAATVVKLMWLRRGAESAIAQIDVSDDGLYNFPDLIDEVEQFELVIEPANAD